jgi:hypothetical protein
MSLSRLLSGSFYHNNLGFTTCPRNGGNFKYLQSDFARYLLGLRKLTQHIPRDRWSWVPYMNTDKEWTDEKLFHFFKLTQAERDHIKKKVQEWS